MEQFSKNDYIVAVSLFQRFSSPALHNAGIITNVCKPLANVIPFLSPTVIGEGWCRAFETDVTAAVKFLFDTGWIDAWPELAQSKIRDQFIYWSSHAKVTYGDYKYATFAVLLSLAMLDFEKTNNHITFPIKGQKRDGKVRRFLASLHCFEDDVVETVVTVIANINFLCKKKNLTVLGKLKHRLGKTPVKVLGSVLGVLSSFNINKRQYECVKDLIRLEDDGWPH